MKQRDHALSVFQQSVYEYINDSVTSKVTIEKDRFKEMLENAYTLFQKGGTSSSLYFGTYKYDQPEEQLFRRHGVMSIIYGEFYQEVEHK